MNELYLWKEIIATYDTAFIDLKTKTIRLENWAGWFEEIPLNEETALSILEEQLVIMYE